MINRSHLIFLLLVSLLSACHNTSFDSVKWKNWKEIDGTNDRWDMSDDLIDNYLKKGITIKEVEILLSDSLTKQETGNIDLYYSLGPCRSGISYGGLTITFRNGKLEKISRTCR
ncbi:hypothetical protein [Fluviicola taffensis]|uniref:hypothetical protein n=1 Tax=Fluviicola taffensis TaxID=191579 RepID=UPI00313805A9